MEAGRCGAACPSLNEKVAHGSPFVAGSKDLASPPNTRNLSPEPESEEGEQVREPSGERRQRRPGTVARLLRTGRDALPLVILALAIVLVPVLVFEPQGLPRLRGLERDLEQVEAENQAVERDIARLRSQVKALKDDLAEVEHVARTELGLVRKSEIVLQLK